MHDGEDGERLADWTAPVETLGPAPAALGDVGLVGAVVEVGGC